jgi:acetyltransferase-like isoleucine patch superfamily enzyme
MAQSHVGAGCVLEEGALLNTQSNLDHDSLLGAFASLAPGAITGGRARIGAGSFIGLGSRLIQEVQVGCNTVVGAGSLVLADLPEGVLAYGTPARVVRSRQPDEPYL